MEVTCQCSIFLCKTHIFIRGLQWKLEMKISFWNNKWDKCIGCTRRGISDLRMLLECVFKWL